MSKYFPKLLRSYGKNVKVKTDLSNYATKTDIKNITHVDNSNFASKTNLANLKTEVNKLDIGKLKTVPVDLSKLFNVVKNEVIKKTKYNKLVNKVNNIYTSGFILKTKYDADKLELEKKIPNSCNVVKKTNYNTKISEIESKIPSISSLATTSALTGVENKIPSINNLDKKTDYDTKVIEIEEKLTDHNQNKYIDNSEFNTLAANVFNTRLSKANLITKTDFDAKLSCLNRKITKNKSKYLLIENELNKLKTFDSIYFIGKSHFEEDDTQNYLVFQPMFRYFGLIPNTSNILSWQSKGLSNEKFNPPNTNFSPSIDYVGKKIRVKFDESCLKQSKKISCTQKKSKYLYCL